MTIPTDGRIDLDALAELAQRLRREAQAFDNDLGSDPEADAGTARLLREAAGAIDLARRAAIPSEQGEAVKRWDLEPDNVQGFLVISATESPDGRWVKAEDALRAALPPSPAVVPEAPPLKDDEGHEWPARLSIRDTKLHDDLSGPGQRIYTTAGRGYKSVEYVRADLSASPSPPALDGAGREGWQSIETAPKDGTRVILNWGGAARVGYYLDNSKTNRPWQGWKVPSMEEWPAGQPVAWMPFPLPLKETP